MKIRHFALALAANLFLAPIAWAAPELAVENGTFNFGSIQQGKKVPHTFKIRNSGDTPLHIKKLEAACGCTAVKPSTSVLQPGKGAEIEVVFDSTSFSGKVQKTVTMTTNAAKTPNYTFVMEGSITEELQVTPRQLSLGALRAGVAKQAMISVTNNGSNRVKLLSVKVTSTSLQITHSIKKSDLKPGESGAIELKITPKPDAKVLSGYLHIVTSGAQKNEITVPIYGSPVR